MTIKVSQSSTGSIGVKLKTASKLNVSVSSEASSVAGGNLSSLDDVDVSGVSDKFVIMYNATTAKFTAVNPDEVLSAASNTETTSVGLPQNFIDTLDVDLDDKIDLDAGSF
jgi:hypothetical protein